MERQKFISGTSDGRGSPEYKESKTSNQRRSIGCWNGKGLAVDSISPPKPLKATRTTLGFFRRKFLSAARKAATLREYFSRRDCVPSPLRVAAVKSTSSFLNGRF